MAQLKSFFRRFKLTLRCWFFVDLAVIAGQVAFDSLTHTSPWETAVGYVCAAYWAARAISLIVTLIREHTRFRKNILGGGAR